MVFVTHQIQFILNNWVIGIWGLNQRCINTEIPNYCILLALLLTVVFWTALLRSRLNEILKIILTSIFCIYRWLNWINTHFHPLEPSELCSEIRYEYENIRVWEYPCMRIPRVWATLCFLLDNVLSTDLYRTGLRGPCVLICKKCPTQRWRQHGKIRSFC